MDWQAILARELDTLTAELSALGGGYERALNDVRAYAASQIESLSRVVDKPGFAEAASASAKNVALYAAIRAVREGDTIDSLARQMWLKSMRTALSVLAQVLASV